MRFARGGTPSESEPVAARFELAIIFVPRVTGLFRWLWVCRRGRNIRRRTWVFLRLFSTGDRPREFFREREPSREYA
jgi:hypothetical protein